MCCEWTPGERSLFELYVVQQPSETDTLKSKFAARLRGLRRIRNYVRKALGEENPTVPWSKLHVYLLAYFWRITSQIMITKLGAWHSWMRLVKSSNTRPIRGSTLVQNPRGTDFWLYIRRLYQRGNLRTRSASCGGTCHNTKSPSSCRQQDDGTYFRWNEEIHNSAAIQPNWMISMSIDISFSWGTTLLPYVCIQGVKWVLHVHLKSTTFYD